MLGEGGLGPKARHRGYGVNEEDEQGYNLVVELARQRCYRRKVVVVVKEKRCARHHCRDRVVVSSSRRMLGKGGRGPRPVVIVARRMRDVGEGAISSSRGGSGDEGGESKDEGVPVIGRVLSATAWAR